MRGKIIGIIMILLVVLAIAGPIVMDKMNEGAWEKKIDQQMKDVETIMNMSK